MKRLGGNPMKTFRVLAAWVVALLAMAASVRGLWHVASFTMKMDDLGAVAIVAMFDISALVTGMRVVENPRRWSAWAGLAALASASAAAQILAASPELGYWRFGHGLLPLGAVWSLHGAVGEHVTEIGKKPAKKRTDKKTTMVQGRGADSAVSTAPPPASASPVPQVDGVRGTAGKVAPVASLADARRKGAHRPTETGAPPLSSPDLVLVEKAVGELIRLNRDGTRREIEDVLGVGNRVAGRLLPAVKEAMAERLAAQEADGGS